MKKVIALIGFVAIAAFANAQGTPKLGHIDSQELLQSMPESAEIEKKVQDFAKTLETSMKTMQTEYSSKLAEYEQKAATMTKTEKETAEGDIVQLQQRMQEFNQSAQERLKKQQAELLQPVIDKVKKAIEDVSKENGYTYVFDASMGILLYQNGDDLLPKVKAKLGVK